MRGSPGSAGSSPGPSSGAVGAGTDVGAGTGASDAGTDAGDVGTDAAGAGRIRAFLLALVAFGAVGLLLELSFLEHWEARPQYVPWVALSLTLLAALAVALRPGRGTLRTFQVVMGLTVAAGLAGLGFHLADNVAFEREVVPDASLGALLWEALHGATPLLAPGSLVQLGLMGLVLTWRHPALRTDPLPASPGSSLEPEDNP